MAVGSVVTSWNQDARSCSAFVRRRRSRRTFLRLWRGTSFRSLLQSCGPGGAEGLKVTVWESSSAVASYRESCES